jgi:hypothetical protein
VYILSAVNEVHTTFFQALCTAKEELIAEGDEAGPALLKLTADVIFPELHPPNALGRGVLPTVLVRQCWKEFRDLILRQGRTLGECASYALPTCQRCAAWTRLDIKLVLYLYCIPRCACVLNLW